LPWSVEPATGHRLARQRAAAGGGPHSLGAAVSSGGIREVGDKKKVLIIDDNINFVKMNSSVLEAGGYEVETAFNAEEGYTKVEYGQPDVIVLDLMMERHDSGFTLAKRLKAHPIFKNIPILMLTAVGEATGFWFSMESDGYWMKTDDFADKPIEPDLLLEKVGRLIEQSAKPEEES
jgi:two-component system alkaline phosphatase synthesis response regulator PhoP